MAQQDAFVHAFHRQHVANGLAAEQGAGIVEAGQIAGDGLFEFGIGVAAVVEGSRQADGADLIVEIVGLAGRVGPAGLLHGFGCQHGLGDLLGGQCGAGRQQHGRHQGCSQRADAPERREGGLHAGHGAWSGGMGVVEGVTGVSVWRVGAVKGLAVENLAVEDLALGDLAEGGEAGGDHGNSCGVGRGS